MKSYTKYLWFNTKKKKEIVPISDEIAQAVKESGVREGFAFVSAMHITAGMVVNDNEPGIWRDIDKWLENLAPQRADYEHHHTGESNADSHLKNILVHHQVIVPVTDGKLDLGPWQQVFYCEFDGQRRKRAIIKVMGE